MYIFHAIFFILDKKGIIIWLHTSNIKYMQMKQNLLNLSHFFFFCFTGAVFYFIILFVLLVRVFNLVFMKCLYLIFTHALGAIDNFYNNLSQLSMCIYTKIVQSTLCRSCFRNMKTSYVRAHVPICLCKIFHPSRKFLDPPFKVWCMKEELNQRMNSF